MCTVKTGRWAGVVTAFITMSDIKDEIDWEFPGKETTQGQSNYFWQGVIRTFPAPRPRPHRVAHSTHPRVLPTAQQTAGETHGNLTDTFSNYHDYTVCAH